MNELERTIQRQAKLIDELRAEIEMTAQADKVKPIQMGLHEKNEVIHEITNAIQRGSEHFWIDGRDIDLPTPQRAGTYTQQRCYAVDKAREIVKTLTAEI